MSSRKISIPKQFFRTATFERSALNEEERTVEMSISSDEPYRRFFGNEILDHTAKSIDLSRLEGGAPLLFNHDRDAHIGRIIEATTDGKTLRIKAKFGNSQLAQEKFADVKDGILRETSVGYCVNRMILEEESEKDGDTYRVVEWMPYEGSLVTIPADNSVGVGRSEEDGNREIEVDSKNHVDSGSSETIPVNQPARLMPETEAPATDSAAENQKTLATERQRVKKINDYVAAFKIDGMKSKVGDLARQAIEAGTDFDAFRCSVLDNWDDAKRVDNPIATIGMSKKDLKRYSLARAMYLVGTGRALDGLEKESSEAQAKILGKDPAGFFIPEDWSGRSIGEINDFNSRQMADQTDALRQMARALSVSNFASAGALVGTDLMAGSFVELLRNKTVMLSLGVTHLSGLVGNVAIPKQTGGATAYWLAEAASVTASDQTFAQIGMLPHQLSAQTAYSKQLLAQSTPSVEALVRNDLARVLALKRDLAMLAGSGASGEPIGILNTVGVQTVTFSAATTWAKILEFETDLATANADQTGTPVWVTSPAVRGKWKGAAIALTGATTVSSAPLWDKDNTVNGYMAYVTNQVASATNLVYFFVPSEFVVGDWAGTDVVVNPFSLDSTGQIRITISQFTDNAVRHPVSFIVSTDSGAQ